MGGIADDTGSLSIRSLGFSAAPLRAADLESFLPSV
jgi:hypothetical protein